MIMKNVVFVYVDKPRIDAFMELLTEDGYTDRSPNATDKKRLVFRIYPKEKLFKRIMYSYGTCLSVEDFIDLFL